MLCQVLGGPSFSFTVHGPTDIDRARTRNLAGKTAHATFYAVFCILGKFPNAIGLLRYVWQRRILRRGARLIEHKDHRTPACG
jgi:hypothetical protein